MALWQKTVAPFSEEHKGGVGPFLKIPRGNSEEVPCVPYKDSDQPGHLPSLIRLSVVHIKSSSEFQLPPC